MLNFQGPDKNKSGLGVKVLVTSNEVTQFQEMTLTRGFQSSVAPQLHFGIGSAEQVDEIKITWPDGKIEILNDIDKNQFLTMDYKNAAYDDKPMLTEASKLF